MDARVIAEGAAGSEACAEAIDFSGAAVPAGNPFGRQPGRKPVERGTDL